MDTRTQRDSTVDAAAGHNNISTLIQRFGNWESTEIGVGTRNRFTGRCWLSGEHLYGFRCQHLIQLGHQIVAGDDCHLERQPRAVDQLPDRATTGLGIHPTCVTDEFNSRLGNAFQMGRHNGSDKIGGIAFFSIRGFGPRQDRHRDLG